MENNALNVAEKLKKSISGIIVGKDDIIEKVTVALLCGGHILLEDIPGTGKTTLAKALAVSAGCAFSRIQFTPDLLPSDLTGINFFNRKDNDFEFRPGAVFANIILADEINRATPRTQSGLLECMEERRVTVEGKTYKLPYPFIVIATQNPIETQGTFPLPEAQLDRFFMRLSMGYPEREFELNMMDKKLEGKIYSKLTAVTSAEEIAAAIEEVCAINVSAAVKNYILDIVSATRTNDKIRLGASPRGTIALLKAAQGRAAVKGRGYVIPDDVKAIACDVLSHRIIAKNNGVYGKRSSSSELIADILNSVKVPSEAKISVSGE